jgi:hypothetical protein
MKAKPLSLYPLKFKEVIEDVLQVKPESKAKPKAKAKQLSQHKKTKVVVLQQTA